MLQGALPIGVIGAGIGGLSAAIRLAVAGHKVHIFEQNPTVGGKMGEIQHAGFRWDTGPSVITMRHVLEELFQHAGARLQDYVQLQPVHPLTRYFFADGVRLDLTADWNQLAAQIAELDSRDVAGYLSFLAHAAELYRITGPVFIYDTPPTPADFRRVALADMLKVAPWQTMQRSIERYVHSPHLRQLLGRFATYVGANPYTAPSTLGVIAHVELTGGVWYPQGGIYRLAAALAELAQSLGVEIHTECPVARIELQHAQVVGLRLEDGRTIPVQATIANLDVTTVYGQLLNQHLPSRHRLRKLESQEPSCSGFAMLLGIAGAHPELCHHNILFSADYPREFREIFDAKTPPGDPTIYIAITSRSDPSHAPPGHENWFVLVNAPALSDRFDWQVERDKYAATVLEVLARRGYDLRDRIRTQHILTPVELAQRTGAWRGALYGISSNHALNAFRRPHNRAQDIRGLYFAGGTTHPGGGVPMVTLSGKVAAQLLLEDFPARQYNRIPKPGSYIAPETIHIRKRQR